MGKFIPILIAGAALLSSCSTSSRESADLLEHLMREDSSFFQHYLDRRDSFEIQVIYTQIDRDENNVPSFRSFNFNHDSTRYFYPASTVKFPLVLLALEKLKQLNIPGLDRNTTMQHDSAWSGQLPASTDSTAPGGLPSVGHYAKKILVVSDNDAFNRLFEFVGQGPTNDLLRNKGFTQSRLIHRLERFLTWEENRRSNPVRFVSGDSLIYRQPMQMNASPPLAPDSIFLHRGYLRGGQLINRPMDFTAKNFFPLTEQQRLLRSFLFPESVPGASRFDLTPDDYLFVLTAMSQYPTETRYPNYPADSAIAYDAYCKFLMYGEDRLPIPRNIRIFNKVGDAYGYLIDNAYIVDFDTGVEFLLTAVINVNTDGVLNDGEYEYSELGFPFLKQLGQTVYRYELKRSRRHKPDLSKFRLRYPV
jgi:hypothetical protein